MSRAPSKKLMNYWILCAYEIIPPGFLIKSLLKKCLIGQFKVFQTATLPGTFSRVSLKHPFKLQSIHALQSLFLPNSRPLRFAAVTFSVTAGFDALAFACLLASIAFFRFSGNPWAPGFGYRLQALQIQTGSLFWSDKVGAWIIPRRSQMGRGSKKSDVSIILTQRAGDSNFKPVHSAYWIQEFTFYH